MKHLSDHIIELYARQSPSLDKDQKKQVHDHLTQCAECRDIYSLFISFWSPEVRMMPGKADSDSAPMKLAASTLNAVKKKSSVHLATCFSADNEWCVQIFEDEKNEKIVIYLISNDTGSLDPVLLSMNCLDQWIVFDSTRKTEIPLSQFSIHPNFSECEIRLKKPILRATHKDEHLLSYSANGVTINTLHPEVLVALLKHGDNPIKWVGMDGSGSLSIDYPGWNQDITVWFYV